MNKPQKHTIKNKSKINESSFVVNVHFWWIFISCAPPVPHGTGTEIRQKSILILGLCFLTTLQWQGGHYFKPLPQFIQYLAFCLFTVLHLAHVFRYFIFAPHFEQNASLSSTNTWHFGHRGTGWLSELVGIIAPHSAQYKFLSRKNQSGNNNTKGIKNIIGASRIIYKIIRPTFRGSATVSFLHLSQYTRIFSPLCLVLSWLDNAFNWFALGWGAQNQKTHIEVFISYCALFYFFLRYVEPRTLTVRVPPVLLLTYVLVLARLLIRLPMLFSFFCALKNHLTKRVVGGSKL